MIKNGAFVLILFFLLILEISISVPLSSIGVQETHGPPMIIINISEFSEIYEGDLVDCEIFGENEKFWWIDQDLDGVRDNDENIHYTFIGDKPQIFRPEPTPVGQDYVGLCVTAINNYFSTTESVNIKLFKIWFGDYHWHSSFCNHATQYFHDVINDTIDDNYLNWLGGCAHDNDLNENEWYELNNALFNVNLNYNNNRFCAFPGYEFSAGRWYRTSKAGHMNVLFKHSFPGLYRCYKTDPDLNLEFPYWDELFYQLHLYETDNNEWAIVIPHHTNSGQTGLNANIVKRPPGTNFEVLFNELKYPTKYEAEKYRLDHLRGTEIMQVRGEQIGGLTKYFYRIYYDDLPNQSWPCLPQSWADWGVFEASQTYDKGQQRFGFFGSADAHEYTHLGSAINSLRHSYAGGITACWAVHNTQDEIFEALNNTNVYASTPLKIRVLAKANGKRFGQWDSLSTPVTISISINSSSAEIQGSDYPYNADVENADFPHNITDIWIIKNTPDHATNLIKAKVIKHVTFQGKTDNIYYEYVYNGELNPGDYFWIAVDQEEDAIMDNDDDEGENTEPVNKHRAWISPFFVAAVHEDDVLVANAGASRNGIKNELIQFYGSATGRTLPYSYFWNFGDGETSTQQNPTHIFTQSGNYNVMLTVTDSNGIQSNDFTNSKIKNEDEKEPDISINQLWNLVYKECEKIIILPFYTYIWGDMIVVAEVSDNWGINRVEFKVNNNPVKTDYIPPYTYVLDHESLLPGEYRIKSIAYDEAGNSNFDIIDVWMYGPK